MTIRCGKLVVAALACAVGACLVVPAFALADDTASSVASAEQATGTEATEGNTAEAGSTDSATPSDPAVTPSDPGTGGENENAGTNGSDDENGGSFAPQEGEDPSTPSEEDSPNEPVNPDTPTMPNEPVVVPSTPDPTTNRNNTPSTRANRNYTNYTATADTPTTQESVETGDVKAPKKAFSAWDGTADTSWYIGHEGKTSYKLRTAQDLAGLAELVNKGYGFEGKRIVLTANIDLAGYEWQPIGQSSYFMGTFDGKGHTIKNLTISEQANYAGLFGASYNASFTNIKLIGVNIDALQYAGGIVGLAYGDTSISDCLVRGEVSADYFVGGIIGLAYAQAGVQLVANTEFDGTVGGGAYSGELIGFTETIA